MGEVYLARDTRLCRDVALKLLPDEFARNSERLRRFEQEAQTLASVNHPNILSIFEVGTHQGAPYLVSELLQGETLREHLQRGRMSERNVLKLSQQIAQGLAAAHDKGVVHRDLKPENLFLTEDDRLKVLDFGLAKLGHLPKARLNPEAPTLAESTQPGQIMGTAGYMSPEQVRGEPVDHCSDLFSLGAILFEMLTGQRAFERATAAETMTAILKEEPPQMAQSNGRLSPGWQRIVARCLEKSPKRRFQSANDFAFALETLSDSAAEIPARARSGIVREPKKSWVVRFGLPAAILSLAAGVVVSIVSIMTKNGPEQTHVQPDGSNSPTQSRQRIAVLPLRSLSSAEQNQIFSEGMTAELLGKLSKIKGLAVIDGSSFMRYKGEGKDDAEVGKQLGANVLLKGSVLREANQVRILLQLVDVGSQAILWPFEYEKQLQDGGQVFDIAREAAAGIASALQVQLGVEERQQLAGKPTANLEVYDLYSRGRYFWARRTGESLHKAIEAFSQAVAKDPNFALGYAGLADSYAVLSFYADVPTQETAPQGLKAARRAIELDPTLAEPHAALGWIKGNYEWDWSGSEREFLEAIRLNPDWPTAYAWFGLILASQGRTSEAIQRSKQAVRLAPDSPLMNALHGGVLLWTRDFRAAEKQLRAALELESNYALARLWLGESLVEQKKFSEAIAELRQASRLFAENTYSKGKLGRAYALVGDRSVAEQVLESLQGRSANNRDVATAMAEVYVALGDKENALTCLEAAVSARSYLLFQTKVYPPFDDLRSEERFIRILKQMGLEK